MASQSSIELTTILFEKVRTLRVRDPAAIFGTTSAEGVLQQLVKSVATLYGLLHDDAPYEATLAAYEEVVMAVDTAALTGIIAEADVTHYYTVTDKMWAAIEREQSKN